MKKILSLLLALIMCLTVLTSCDVQGTIEQVKGTIGPVIEQIQVFIGGILGDKPVEEEYHIDKAESFLKNMYKDVNPVTGADYEVVGQVRVAGVAYTVTWESNSEQVVIVALENGNYLVDLNEKATEDVAYVLTATITAGNGETATVTYNRTIPKYNVLSWDAYMAAQKGDVVLVEGIVAEMNAKSLGNSRNHLFLMDASGKGGYYVYQMDQDPAEAGVKIGMTVSVSGPVEPYSGMQEIKGGTFTIVDETIKTVEPIDITDLVVAGTVNYAEYVALPVTIKGVTLGAQDMTKDSSQYLYFDMPDGTRAYVRTYVTDFPTTLSKAPTAENADKAAIDKLHADHFGYTADVTGILILYSGNPYLIPMSTDCFSNLKWAEKTADEKIAAEKELVSIETDLSVDAEHTLPVAGVNYEDVVITWSSDAEGVVIEGGKLTFVNITETTKVTLTATLSCGDKTDTLTFEVTARVADKQLYIGKPTTDVVEGTAYKFGFNQVSLGKTLYLTGEVSGRYLVTSEYLADAIDIYAELVEGGVKFYYLNGETKNYIEVYNNESGKLSVQFSANGSVFAYNATVNAWVTTLEGAEYYIGTYSTFNTLSASKLSYITAENTGVSQFPAGAYVLATAEYATESTHDVVEGTAYKFGFNQVSLGKTLYLTGEVSGRYLVTSEYLADAIDIYAELVEGGVKFYYLNGETKNYIEVYNNESGKLSVQFSANGSVFAYNATVNAWVTTLEGAEYYIGTYSTFNTLSASKLSYITAENTGVSQFPAGAYSLTLKETAVVNKSEVSEGVDYKFGFVQVSLGKTLYLNGEVSGRYLVTTEYYNEAVTIYVEKVEGGYKFYYLNGETKNYIEVYNNESGKLSVQYSANGSVFVYNATVNAWVTTFEGAEYYIGTYSTFNTLSASKLSYITAENTGVSQFPGNFFRYEFVTEDVEEPTPEEPAHECEHVCETCHKCTDADCTESVCAEKCEGHETTEEPEVAVRDGNYTVSAYNANGTLYFDGTVSSGRFNGVTSESGAAVVTVKTVDGGYILSVGTQYIVMEDKAAGCGFTTNASAATVFVWNDTLNTYVVADPENARAFGCQNTSTYSNFSAYAVSNTSGYNWGVFTKVEGAETPGEPVVPTHECESVCATCQKCTDTSCTETVCAEKCKGHTEEPAPESGTAVVVIADYADAKGWDNSKLYDTIVVNSYVTVTATGTPVGTYSLNTGKYYTSGENWRIYQNENPAVTIAAAEGKTIVSVKITYSTKNTGVLTLNGENVESGTVVTVNASSITFSVGNTNAEVTNGQAQITSIEVVYE